MPTHIVTDGECLTSIASTYGLPEEQIIGHPQNAALKAVRPDKGQLHPGDSLFIPERRRKTVMLATGRRHTMVVRSPKKLLRLRLLDPDGNPMAGVPYALETEGRTLKGSLDDDGLLEQAIPVQATRATLHLGGSTRTILIGHLNPLRQTPDNGLSGAQARLSNLGFEAGPVDGVPGPQLRAALSAFQAAYGLTASGQLDEQTAQKLKEIHGC